MTLAKYNKQYEEIIHSDLSSNEKHMKLTELMTALEKAFRIPVLRKPEWEQKNRTVMALYRKISLTRNL